jgi:hypothetical protein
MEDAATTTSIAEELIAQVDAANPFDYEPADLLPKQIAAIDERFQDRVHKIKLLQNRADAGKVAQVQCMEDVVPLLFAHTAYKSYPEGWLSEQKWDRMGRWLDTVSTTRVKPQDKDGAKGLDDWLGKLAEQGHYVSCSSGTTGKCAMMNATQSDLDFSGYNLLRGMIWQGLRPNNDRRMISLGQVASTPRNRATGRPMAEAVSLPGVAPFAPNVPPITIGGITEMVTLRKKLADGTATPSEIAHYEAEAAAREKAMESAVEQVTDALIENRHSKLHIMGMTGALYKAAELVRARGFSGKDFHPENTGYTAGGLKRQVVPENYRDIIFETLNLSPDRLYQAYGMQELNSSALRCTHGRYHVPSWLVLFLLDEPGETLLSPPARGEIEGRAAFFDLSLDGRWGGVISGDKIRVSYERCACGNRSPSIHPEIQRYADLASGDKITCSGTIDAYVRGVS